MAKLIPKQVGGVTFGCYSERGIISHLVFRALPQKLDEFLNLLGFPRDVGNRFAGATAADLSEITLFSELDFGTVGFGKPDGAVRFRFRNSTYFIFIEGKVNEDYAASCKVGKRRQKAEASPGGAANATPTISVPGGTRTTKGYNSTIRGQLELRYRMVRLYKEYPEARAPLPLGDDPVPEEELDDETPEDELLRTAEKRPDCLHEINAVKEVYGDRDGFYARRKNADPTKLRSWRRVWLRDGVADVFKHLEHTPEDNIYFLTFTDEATNPFDTLTDELLPRLFDSDWTARRHRFPWISSHTVENQWNHV
jgi:hypothetical protein